MDRSLKRKLVAGAVVGLAVAGGGGALAAEKLGSPSAESEAVVSDAAKQLGIQPSALSNALKNALEHRVDAAVSDGRLTKEQGDALKKAIESGAVPLFGGFHRGFGFGLHFGLFGDLDAAASYLGLTDAELRERLESGKTLAQVAKDQGKSVDGLVQALVDAAKKRLDAAVSAGRLTKEHEDSILTELKQRITDFVNGMRPRFHDDGFRGFREFGPPPVFPAA
jgi:hypothetical protein